MQIIEAMKKHEPPIDDRMYRLHVRICKAFVNPSRLRIQDGLRSAPGRPACAGAQWP